MVLCHMLRYFEFNTRVTEYSIVAKNTTKFFGVVKTKIFFKRICVFEQAFGIAQWLPLCLSFLFAIRSLWPTIFDFGNDCARSPVCG